MLHIHSLLMLFKREFTNKIQILLSKINTKMSSHNIYKELLCYLYSDCDDNGEK
jgi:hypothetical protein